MTTLVAPNTRCHPQRVSFTKTDKGVRVVYDNVDHVVSLKKAEAFRSLLLKGHYVTK